MNSYEIGNILSKISERIIYTYANKEYMIIKTSAIKNFLSNSERTEMLIIAISKIKTYNWLYQQKTYGENPEFDQVVKNVQNKELLKIETSCAEHAIISLCTNFEVYYKDLIQELLSKYPLFFQNKNLKSQEKIINMISSKKRYDYELISKELNLKNRFDFIEFLDEYKIPFLNNDEKNIIEYIYAIRNNYVHSAGRMDKKTKEKLKKYPSPTKEAYLTTEAKRLRTKFNRLIKKIHNRVEEGIKEPIN